MACVQTIVPEVYIKLYILLVTVLFLLQHCVPYSKNCFKPNRSKPIVLYHQLHKLFTIRAVACAEKHQAIPK